MTISLRHTKAGQAWASQGQRTENFGAECLEEKYTKLKIQRQSG